MAPPRLRARLWAGLAAAHLAVTATPLAAGDAPAVLPPPATGLAPLVLTIEEARLKALAANSSLELGRLSFVGATASFTFVEPMQADVN